MPRRRRGGSGETAEADTVRGMSALVALAASLMWGTSDFLGGTLSRRLRPVEVYAVAQVIGLLLLAIGLVVTGELALLGDVAVPGLMAGVLAFVGMICLYQALAIGPMGIVAPLASLSVIVPVGYALIGGESPSPLQMLGILLAIAGIVLACGPELSNPNGARPLVLAVVTAVTLGTSLIFMARGSEVSALATMTMLRVAALGLCVLAILVMRWRLEVRPRDMPAIAGIGVLETGANVSFGVASSLGLLTIASVLSSLYPVVTAILAAVFLRERLRPVQYAGVGCAMVGVVLIVLMAA